MNYKKKILEKIRLLCLKLKLKFLERERRWIVESYIFSNPSQASKGDNIDSKIVSDQFEMVKFKIVVIKRLLQKIEK